MKTKNTKNKKISFLNIIKNYDDEKMFLFFVIFVFDLMEEEVIEVR